MIDLDKGKYGEVYKVSLFLHVRSKLIDTRRRLPFNVAVSLNFRTSLAKTAECAW